MEKISDPSDFDTPVDYARSAEKLSAWLRNARESGWTSTESTKRLRDLASQLDGLVAELAKPEYMELQDAVDEDIEEIGEDGFPVPVPREQSRLGRYEGCQWRMLEISEFARKLADDYPAPQARPYMKEAATAFLHLWREDNRSRPTMYENGEAVLEFARILEAGGVFLERSSVRGILTKAWNEFDSHYLGDLFREIIVWRK